jgi:hypothetical protein
MLIGNTNKIPSIVNLLGPNNVDSNNGFAFKFTKGADSWFEASNVAVGNYTSMALSCWITIDAEFFNDPAPNTSETQHIIDKYAFVTEGSETVQKGYRLILEKGLNQGGSIYRRLVFQAGVGNNDATPSTGKAVIPVTDESNPGNDLLPDTVYLVMASIDDQNMVLQLKGENNVLRSVLAVAPDPMALSNSFLVIGNANPNNLAAEFGGKVDEVAIWENKKLNQSFPIVINQIFDWPQYKNLNLQAGSGGNNFGPPPLWYQMGEGASILNGEYVLPNIGSYNTTVSSLTGTGTGSNRITPGLPNELYP